jgi:hypothetical protein
VIVNLSFIAQAQARSFLRQGATAARRSAMAEKSTFVDMIQEATRQRWRRPVARAAKPVAEEKPRLGRWPPPLRKEFRLALLKPWKFRE